MNTTVHNMILITLFSASIAGCSEAQDEAPPTRSVSAISYADTAGCFDPTAAALIECTPPAEEQGSVCVVDKETNAAYRVRKGCKLDERFVDCADEQEARDLSSVCLTPFELGTCPQDTIAVKGWTIDEAALCFLAPVVVDCVSQPPVATSASCLLEPSTGRRFVATVDVLPPTFVGCTMERALSDLRSCGVDCTQSAPYEVSFLGEDGCLEDIGMLHCLWKSYEYGGVYVDSIMWLQNEITGAVVQSPQAVSEPVAPWRETASVRYCAQ
ncbi:MAG: hypothetical protein AUK47_04530 [Deltaproteobacteria bacterium CG2_30_63_29]|nr:MAG: hypothetical protein AUK47_04530 [Deltaproteobacteria bacterium CG2_30_63_29]